MLPFTPAQDPNSTASRPLNVLMVGLEWFSDNPGGGGRYLADVSRGLAARGHSVTVLVPRLSAETAPFEIIDDVHLHRFPLQGAADKLFSACRAVPRLVAERGPFDVVHSHFSLYGACVLWHPALARARRVTQFQGPWAAESVVEGGGHVGRSVKYALERLAYGRSEAFIVLSQAFKDLLARDYHVKPARIHVIPAGIDTQRFHPAASRQEPREALGWGPAPVLFAMRRLVRRMGLEVLLGAFAHVHTFFPDARLVIAGTGPLADELKDLTQRLGLKGAVSWLGRVSDADLVRCYQAADLTVVPTVALEGFGLITVESLACGTPVVGTSEGGTAEILAPFTPQLLVPRGDVPALAERLSACLEHPERLPDAEACRGYALEHFAWPEVLKQVEAVLAGGSV